ncbi:MAG: DUF1835 domain-containing protein, partial [Mesobacillus sp.]|uniref:DUF1835 domain-containing protein n=1 Tax=Mesobacillus sp. TaxID=2675271 RepID=UPI003C578587
MIEDLRRSIQQLSENDAKSILLQTMIRVKMIRESNESPGQMIEDLLSWCNEIEDSLQNDQVVERDYKTVHLVCGESAAGSLRFTLGHEHMIIGFPDFFAVGPIEKLHTKAGLQRRYDWLRDHLNFSDDYFEEEYENRYSSTLAEIEAIPPHVPIVIWTAENADEQTGIRYLFYLIKEKTNDIYLINTTTAYQELFNTKEYQYLYSHTGGPEPEKINEIFQKKSSSPLTQEERRRFEKEWMTLSESKEVLRIWKNHSVIAVNEDYFDGLIITTAQKLHSKKSEKDFIKAARIIGEVYGRIDNHVGDAFLEDRLRALVYKGVFEIKGIPKGMRYY